MSAPNANVALQAIFYKVHLKRVTCQLLLLSSFDVNFKSMPVGRQPLTEPLVLGKWTFFPVLQNYKTVYRPHCARHICQNLSNKQKDLTSTWRAAQKYLLILWPDQTGTLKFSARRSFFPLNHNTACFVHNLERYTHPINFGISSRELNYSMEFGKTISVKQERWSFIIILQIY